MDTNDNKEFNYYRDELNKIITTGEYLPKIQIRDEEGNSTKWMNLNKECIDEVIYLLQLMRNKYK